MEGGFDKREGTGTAAASQAGAPFPGRAGCSTQRSFILRTPQTLPPRKRLFFFPPSKQRARQGHTAAPCQQPAAPPCPFHSRLQLPACPALGGIPPSLSLCKYNAEPPPITGRGRGGARAVTWREASFLCAPLFPSLAAILCAPRVGPPRGRRAQVRTAPRPPASCGRRPGLFPVPSLPFCPASGRGRGEARPGRGAAGSARPWRAAAALGVSLRAPRGRPARGAPRPEGVLAPLRVFEVFSL